MNETTKETLKDCGKLILAQFIFVLSILGVILLVASLALVIYGAFLFHEGVGYMTVGIMASKFLSKVNFKKAIGKL